MEFKICTVVGCHPSTEKKESILRECLRPLKSSGLYTIVTSHALPSQQVQELCDLYFYERANEYVRKEELMSLLTPHSSHYFFKFDNHIYRSQLDLFRIEGSHHYAAFRNMLSGAKLAIAQGYDDVIFTEGDNVFDERDFLYLVSRVKGCIREGKVGLFFRGHPDGVNAFSVLVCYFNAHFFVKKFGHVQNKADWLELAKSAGGDVTVEKIFTHVLENENVKVLHVESPHDDRLSQYFPSSRTNVIDASVAEHRELPVANICSEWNPEFSAEKMFLFATRCPGAKDVTLQILSEGQLMKKAFVELRQDVAVLPLSFDTQRDLTFRITWTFEDDPSETREFSLPKGSLKKYLQLNTLQFGFR